jgi:hypothetical protein
MQNLWDLFHLGYVLGLRDEGELAAKLVWRVKLVTEKPTIPEQIADRVEVRLPWRSLGSVLVGISG